VELLDSNGEVMPEISSNEVPRERVVEPPRDILPDDEENI